MNNRGVLYGQKLADPALMRIGLNIVRWYKERIRAAAFDQ